MLIIGERINTSRKVGGEPVIENAVVARDVAYIQKLVSDQVAAGAHYVDVNCGTLRDGEPDAIEWLVKTVQDAVDAPLSMDTPNTAALERALAAYSGAQKPMVNSITAESDRFEKTLPLVKKYNAKVIALCMDDSGIQTEAEKRRQVGRELIKRLTGAGVSADDIYVDPLTFPIGTGPDVATAMLGTIAALKDEFPDVHVIAGISNVSQGLPARKILNQAMTILAMCKGLDAAIIDPMDRYLMALIAAAEALLGCDEFCMNYIAMSREGKFEGL